MADDTVVERDPERCPNGHELGPNRVIRAGSRASAPQYTSIRLTQRLAEAGAAPSVGSVGDAYDNALAETEIGLFKTELINQRSPWRTLDQVEIGTLEWVDWFNNRRLHTACADLTPAEFEQVHYRQHPALAETLVPTP